MDQYFKMKQAEEEIECLNVEVRRVRTWIRDDEELHRRTIDSLTTSDPALATELRRRLRLLSSTNLIILAKLDHTESLNGFTGQRGCGMGEFSLRVDPHMASATPPHAPSNNVAADTSTVSDPDSNNEDHQAQDTRAAVLDDLD